MIRLIIAREVMACLPALRACIIPSHELQTPLRFTGTHRAAGACAPSVTQTETIARPDMRLREVSLKASIARSSRPGVISAATTCYASTRVELALSLQPDRSQQQCLRFSEEQKKRFRELLDFQLFADELAGL